MLDNSGFVDIDMSNRVPFGIDDVALYPLFTPEVLDLMRRLIPEERSGRGWPCRSRQQAERLNGRWQGPRRRTGNFIASPHMGNAGHPAVVLPSEGSSHEEAVMRPTETARCDRTGW